MLCFLSLFLLCIQYFFYFGSSFTLIRSSIFSCSIRSKILVRSINVNSNTDVFPRSDRDNSIDFVKQIGKIFTNTILLNTLVQSTKVNADVKAPVVVLGSGGKTGKLIVEILGDKGYPVRPTYRDVNNKNKIFEKFSSVEAPAAADVTKIDTLESAIAGASTVVFAASASNKGGNAKQVDFQGVENVAKECIRLKIPRLVIISR